MRIGPYNIEFYNVRKHRPTFSGVDWLDIGGDREMRPFADADLTAIMMMIVDRANNADYHADVEYEALKALFAMIHRDGLAIIRTLFNEGSLDICIRNPFRPHLWRGREYEGTDRITERDLVHISDPFYATTGKTRAEMLRPQIDMLNTVNDSDLNLIRNYGAMGVLSPENSSRADGYMDDEQMEELQKEYRKNYGVRFGKWALLITRRAVRFQRIDLPIKELELNEKRKAALASILQFLNVPKELHSMFESAKYANRNEAELDMYTNCVSGWCDLFVRIIRKCYQRLVIDNPGGVGYIASNEIYYDFTDVPAIAAARWEDRQRMREEIAMWRDLLAMAPDRAADIDKRINDLIDTL